MHNDEASHTALRERIVELENALSALAHACAVEFLSPKTEEGPDRYEDDESVYVKPDGPTAMTFGVIRRAQQTLRKPGRR